jgi:hypothetical protein
LRVAPNDSESFIVLHLYLLAAECIREEKRQLGRTSSTFA